MTASSARPSAATRSRWARRALTTASWAPAFIALAYLGVFVARFPDLIRRVYWYSDAAMFTVVAQTIGRSGGAMLAHLGWFVSLLFALSTRWLPFHRELWEVSPCFFALTTVALLAGTTWRLSGRWAGAMTAAIGLATSPVVTFTRVPLDFHADAYMAAIVMAVYVVWLTRLPARGRAIAGGLVLSLLVGGVLASDALLAVVGFVPFVVAGLVLLALPRMRFAGALVLGCASLALPLSRLTNWAMTRSLVHVAPPAQLQFAPANELWRNVRRFVGLAAQAANGPYSPEGWMHASLSAPYVLGLACTAVSVAALALPFVLVVRELRAPQRSSVRLVWAAFWATSVAATFLGYVLSQEGEVAGFYVIPVLFALAATVPLVCADSARRRLIGGLVIALVVSTSLVNLLGRNWSFVPLAPVAGVADRIVAIARAEHAPYGYTVDYWDASALTWNTNFRVRVEPIQGCGPKLVCPFDINYLTTWFQPHHSRSFVLADSKSVYRNLDVRELFGVPSATFQIDREFTMYIFPYDVARRIDVRTQSWYPSVSYGAGFSGAALLRGIYSRRMSGEAQLRIHSGVPAEIILRATASSNHVTRLLEILDGSGRVLGRQKVLPSATALRFGPIAVPAGDSTLTLLVRPGPTPPDAASQTSVLIGPLTLSASLAYADDSG